MHDLWHCSGLDASAHTPHVTSMVIFGFKVMIRCGSQLMSLSTPPFKSGPELCVFITAGPSTKLFAWGGGDGHTSEQSSKKAKSESIVCVFLCFM